MAKPKAEVPRSLIRVIVAASAAILAYMFAVRTSDTAAFVHKFIHLLSFSALFGAQIWTGFVLGPVLIRTLSRHGFGTAQNALFPYYFSSSLVMSSALLVSFVLQHPVSAWTSHITYQVVALSVLLLCMAINGLYISPQAVIATKEMFAIEGKEAAEGVGFKVSDEVLNKPGYKEIRKRFGKMHGTSIILNLCALGCSVFHLFYLAENLTI